MEHIQLIGGFDELARALEDAEQLFQPLASEAISISLLAIEKELAPYPPQPDRDRSKHFNTYVRGQGFYPRSAFIADSSEPGGYKTKRVSKGQVRLTSQQLDKRWKTNVKLKGNVLEGELRNDASYSGYVNGYKTEEPKQTDFHAETGWQNADDGIKNATPTIVNSINSAIDKFLRKLAGK